MPVKEPYLEAEAKYKEAYEKMKELAKANKIQAEIEDADKAVREAYEEIQDLRWILPPAARNVWNALRGKNTILSF